MASIRIKYFLLISCIFLKLISQDSLRNKLSFSIYPLNLFVGDVPIGLEYKFSEHFSNELSINIKCFEPQIFFKYTNGLKLQEMFKWSLIRKSKFQFKLEALLCYRNFYFQNKEDSWDERFPKDDLGNSDLAFSMNRKLVTFGSGLGVGIYTKMFKFLTVSLSSYAEYYYFTKYYTVNKVLRGDISRYPDIVIPYGGSYSGRAWFPNILIRLGYEIN